MAAIEHGKRKFWSKLGVVCLLTVAMLGGTSMQAQATSYAAPTTAVGATSVMQTATFHFSSPVTLNAVLGTAIQVVTQGAIDQDYIYDSVDHDVSSCIAGASYMSGDSCTVNFFFTPKHPWTRYGGINLADTASVIVASAYLIGTGTGPQAAFIPASTAVPIALGGGFYEPTGVAVDAAGNVYVADQVNRQIKKMPAGCLDSSCTTILGGGAFFATAGVAVDGVGNVYVASPAATVSEMPANCFTSSCVTTIGGGFTAPIAVAVDSSGNVYVADYGTRAVTRMPPNCFSSSCVTTIGGGYNNPEGVAVDLSGNVYVADQQNQTVTEIPPGCINASCVVTIGGGFVSPTGVALDGFGNVYVTDADYTADLLAKIPPGCMDSSCVVQVGSGYSYPDGIALDGSGNLYIGDQRNNQVKMIDVQNAPSLSFGNVTIGNSSAQQVVTLGNNGNAPLTISVLAGTNGSFNGAATTCSASGAGATVASGGTCLLGAEFVPAVTGLTTGTASIADNTLNVSATQAVALTGTGVGSGSTAQTITFPALPSIVNTSVAPINLTATASSTLPVYYTATGPAILSGSMLTITGTGTVIVTAHQDGDNTYAPAVTVAQSILVTNVPNLAVGTSSGTLTATVYFTTSFTFGAATVTTDGLNGLDFQKVSDTCTAVSYNPGDNCTVSYTFTPTHPWERRGGITVTDSTGAVVATTFLSGIGTGPQVNFGTSAAPVLLAAPAGGYLQPRGIAVDAGGNVFVTDQSKPAVYEILAVGGYTTVNTLYSADLIQPFGVTVDGSGNVYTMDIGNNVVAIQPLACSSSSCVTPLDPGFSGPAAAVVDSSGNLYVSDTSNSRIAMLPPGCLTGSCSITLGGGFDSDIGPYGITLDKNRNVYVADTGNAALKEIPQGCFAASCVITLGGGFSGPLGVAVDGAGNVYVTDTSGLLTKMPPNCFSSACVTTIPNSLTKPYGLAVDASGNLYVSDVVTLGVYRIDAQDAPALAFPNTNINTTSAPQVVLFGNNGNAPLSASTPGLSVSTDFIQVAGSGTPVDCAPNFFLGSGESCNISAEFAPLSAGTISGSIVLTDNNFNGSGATQTIDLSGISTPPPPIAGAVNAAVAFNSTDDPITLDLSGGAAVSVAIDTESAHGTATASGLGITYTPTAGYSGSDSFTYTATNTGGTSTPATVSITIVPTSYTVPVTVVGATSSTQTATFIFTSSVTLNSTLATAIQVVTQGITGLDFQYVTGGTCAAGASYISGQYCTVNYNFTPAHPWTRFGGIKLVGSAGATLESTFLSGIGNAPQAAFIPASTAVPTLLGGGFFKPTGVAVDAGENIYVTDQYNSLIKEMPAGCLDASCTTTLAGDFYYFNPTGIAVDGLGNVYVADPFTSQVTEMPSGCVISSCVTPLGGGFVAPTSVAVDAAGNVYVADYGTHAATEMPANCLTSSCVTPVGGGYNNPQGIAVDVSGNVYVADQQNATVTKIVPGCADSSCPIPIGGGFSNPSSLAVDGGGNVYVGDSMTNLLTMIPPGCLSAACVSTRGGGYSYPGGVAVDGSGNLYIGDLNNNELKKIDVQDAPRLSFVATTVGSSSAQQVVTLANNGNLSLTISALSGISANFGGAGTSCTTSAAVASGTSCGLGVQFAPAASGLIAASASITSNTLNATTAQTIAITGTGLGVGSTTQTITFPALPATVQSGIPPVTLTATATSALAVYYTVTGPGTLSGSTLTITGAGTVAVTAHQDGDAVYASAPSVTQSIFVSAGPILPVRTASGTLIATMTFTSAVTLNATLTSAIQVTTQGVSGLDFNYLAGGTCTPGGSYDSTHSCTVNYTFTPQHPGLRSGGIVLVNAAGNSVSSTFLSGYGTGPQATFGTSAVPVVLGTPAGGYVTPRGIAVDAAGNVFVADQGDASLYKILAAGGYTTVNTIGGGGLIKPYGIAVDGKGNVYAGDVMAEVVTMRPQDCLSSSCVTTTESTLSGPTALAVDSSGNMYISDTGHNRIALYPAGCFSGSCAVTVGGGFNLAYGIALDKSGNVYVADNANHAVKEIPPGCFDASCVVTLGGGFATPTGVAVDAAGNVYVADPGGLLGMMTPNCFSAACVTAINSGFIHPFNVAVDGSGNLYVNDIGAGTINRIDVRSAPALTFSSTVVGTSSAQQIVTLGNNGNADLTLSALAFAGTTSYNLTGAGTTCTATSTVASGTSCGLGVVLKPVVSGSLPGTLNVTDDDLNVSAAVQAITLQGSAPAVIPATGAVSATVPFNSSSNAIPLDITGPDAAVSVAIGTATTHGTTSVSGTSITYTPMHGYSGSDSFTYTAANAGGTSAPATVSITVNPAVAAIQAVASISLTKSTAAVSVTPVTGSGGTGTLGYSVLPALPTGLSFSLTTGAITGTPTATSVAATYTVTVTDSVSATATASFSLTVNPIVVATQSIASSTLTQSHAVTSFIPITGSGGTTPLVYSVSPSLPTGLSLNMNTGAITGTASVTSIATTYTLTITDANSATATASFSLTVNTAVAATQAIASTSLTKNTAAISFKPVTGSGGTSALSYSVLPTLPTGLSLSPTTGAITGTPTATSVTATYTVTIADANSATATAMFSLTVNPIVVATQAVASTSLTQSYAATSFIPVTGSGGTTPIAYSVSPSLPTGLSLNMNTGAITGTASVTSLATTYTVTVTDANNATATAAFSLTVNTAVAATQAIASMTLTEGTAATSSTPVTATGGTGTLTYSVLPTLPTGLNLSPTTGAITGTPSVASPATTYTVTATDANSATATASFSLTVTQPVPIITVTATSIVFGKGNKNLSAAFAFTGSTPPTGLVTFQVDTATPANASCTVTSATSMACSVTYPTATFTVPTHIITVMIAADINFPAASGTGMLTVTQAAQAITFTAPASPVTNGVSPITLVATGGASTSAVIFTIDAASTATGSISGSMLSITGAGTLVIDANQASDTNYSAATQVQRSIVVNPAVTATRSIVSTTLTQNKAATSFTPVTGGGGTGTLAYSITPALPASLTLSTSTGAITGTPSVTSTATTYTVSVTDVNSATANATFSLTVSSAVAAAQGIASTTLTQNKAAVPFTPVTGAGGTGTLSYSVLPTLPATLSLNAATGAITGTPSETSTATTYTVTVTDANNATATAAFSLSVNSVVTATQAVVSKILTQNVAATAFTPVTATGGTGTLTYSVLPALPAGLTLSPTTGAVTGTPTTPAAAATYTVTITDTNSATAAASFSLTVTQPAPIITVSAASVAYSTASKTLSAALAYTGSDAPTGLFTFQVDAGAIVTASCTGSSSPLTCTASYNTTALTVTSHTITAILAADINFATASATNTLTVTQAPQTISFTAPVTPVSYGVSPIALAANGGASTNAVTFTIDAASTATGSISGSTLTVTSAGTLVIDANQTGNTSYSAATQAQQSIVINKALLTVTANAASMAYGGPIPTLSGTLTGVVNSDGITAAYATNATITSPVGNTYAVTPTLVDPNSRLTNYTVTNNTAVFTVTNGAVLTVTAANASRVYGTANPTLTASYIGQQGTDTFNATAGTSAIATSPVLAGGYTIVPAVTANPGASLNNYTVVLVNGTFTITQAATSVTLQQTLPATTGVGTGVAATFTATVSGGGIGTPTGRVQFFDNGTSLGIRSMTDGVATLVTTFTTATTHPITAQYLSDMNFAGNTSGTLNESVVIPSFSIVANPNSISIQHGSSGTATLTFTPVGNYQGTLSLACNGLPAFSSCQFTPSSITFTGNNAVQTSQLVVYTLNAAAVTGTSSNGLLWIPACLLACFIALRRRKLGFRPLLMFAVAAFALAAMTALTGCGSSAHFVTPAGTDIVTVTASATGTPGTSSSNTTQTATITITITP